jgi:hypothetical protein
MKTFYSDYLKAEIVEISKAKARKLYNQGVEIFLQSKNMLFDNAWQSAYGIKKSNETDTFDSIVNRYAYYNCDSERGKTPNYYTRAN